MTDTRKETAVEAAKRLLREHPDRFKEAPQTGEGYVILGAKPPKKEHSDEAQDADE
jgi:hypothetical protein